MSDNKDFQAPPWWKHSKDDYTKYRAGVSYTMDDLIGRKDHKKYLLVTEDAEATISGVEDARIVSST